MSLCAIFAPETAAWTTFVVSQHFSKHFAKVKSHLVNGDVAFKEEEVAQNLKLLVVSPQLESICDRFPGTRATLLRMLSDSSKVIVVDSTRYAGVEGARVSTAGVLLAAATEAGVDLRHYDGEDSKEEQNRFILSLTKAAAEMKTVEAKKSMKRRGSASSVSTGSVGASTSVGTASVSSGSADTNPSREVQEMIVSPSAFPTKGDNRAYVILQTWRLDPDADFRLRIRRAGSGSCEDDDDDDSSPIPFYKLINPHCVVFRVPPDSKGLAVVSLSQNGRREEAKVLYQTPTALLSKHLEASLDPLEIFAESLDLPRATPDEVDRQLSHRLKYGRPPTDGKRGAGSRQASDTGSTASSGSKTPADETPQATFTDDQGFSMSASSSSSSRRRFPTLLHFCAANGLVNSAAVLSETPGFREALRRRDADRRTPLETALANGHEQLADFFVDFFDLHERQSALSTPKENGESAKSFYEDDLEDEEVCRSMNLVSLEKYEAMRAREKERGEEEAEEGRRETGEGGEEERGGNESEADVIDSDADEVNPLVGALDIPPMGLDQNKESDSVPNSTPTTSRSPRSRDRASSIFFGSLKKFKHSLGTTPESTVDGDAKTPVLDEVTDETRLEIRGTREEMKKMNAMLNNGDISKSQYFALFEEWNQKTDYGRSFKAGEGDFATTVNVVRFINRKKKTVKEKSARDWPRLSTKNSSKKRNRKNSCADPNLESAVEMIRCGAGDQLEPERRGSDPFLSQRISLVSEASSAGYATSDDVEEGERPEPAIRPVIGMRSKSRVDGGGGGVSRNGSFGKALVYE